MKTGSNEFAVLPSQVRLHSSIEFHLTGFGSFKEVDVNPSSILVKKLEEGLKEKPIPGVIIGTTRVLEVEPKACIKGVESILEAIEIKKNPDTKYAIIHFGVARSRSNFTIEAKGYNKDNFSMKPNVIPIIKDITCGHSIETIIPYTAITTNLQHLGFSVDISTDPGSYLCNYIYYVSLYKTLPSHIPSLFVHIPKFDFVPEAKQVEFAYELLKEFKRSYL